MTEWTAGGVMEREARKARHESVSAPAGRHVYRYGTIEDSQLRHGMRTAHAAPLGLFFILGSSYYKHAAPDGADAPNKFTRSTVEDWLGGGRLSGIVRSRARGFRGCSPR